MTETGTGDERVKCRSCDRMPLASTAARNDGLCGVCEKDRKYQELQDSRKKYLENPPRTQEEVDELAPPGDIESLGLASFLESIRPPLIDPRHSTKADFIREVNRLSSKYSSDRHRAVMEFMHLCEPFFRGGWSKKSALRRIPRPFREMYALLCAWGSVGSDGFDCYAENYKKWWDAEADRGLAFFGFEQARGALKEARKAWKRHGDELPEAADERLWESFYEPIEHFEEEILGEYLVTYSA